MCVALLKLYAKFFVFAFFLGRGSIVSDSQRYLILKEIKITALGLC